jgi:hypothetical protein
MALGASSALGSAGSDAKACGRRAPDSKITAKDVKFLKGVTTCLVDRVRGRHDAPPNIGTLTDRVARKALRRAIKDGDGGAGGGPFKRTGKYIRKELSDGDFCDGSSFDIKWFVDDTTHTAKTPREVAKTVRSEENNWVFLDPIGLRAVATAKGRYFRHNTRHGGAAVLVLVARCNY